MIKSFGILLVKCYNSIIMNNLIKTTLNILLLSFIFLSAVDCGLGNQAKLIDISDEQDKANNRLIIPGNKKVVFEGDEWNNLDVIDIQKLPPRAAFISLSSEEVANDLVSDRHFFLDKASINRANDVEGNTKRQADVSKKRWFETIEDEKSFLILNGEWRFNWVMKPADAPDKFYSPTYRDRGADWDDFLVPANWEYHDHTKEAITATDYKIRQKDPFYLQTETIGGKPVKKKVYKRYGEPIYLNHSYEFADLNDTNNAKPIRGFNYKAGRQPHVPTIYNPVGSYRRSVMLPKAWNGKRILFHVGAAKAALYVWVNGKAVGYSEDSKTPAEFDITPYVRLGRKNVIAMQVYRWSNGTYLECQDFWRISGIERDVYINAVPKSHIYDFSIATPFKPSRSKNTSDNASLDCRLTLANISDKVATHKLSFTLRDVAGASSVKDASVLWQESFTVKVRSKNVKKILIKKKIADKVKLWSANNPYLYHLEMVSEVTGTKVDKEVISKRIGFRQVKIDGHNLLVNGKKVLLLGANRHEHEPASFHVISRQSMLYDALLMKTNNLNAVRNAHYPPDPYWYELCDRMGIYVVDEANIESHGIGYNLRQTLGNRERWQSAHLKRIQAMAERSKNSPSVIMWSMGNEAGGGINFQAAYRWLGNHYDKRPVVYERITNLNSQYIDVSSMMYNSVARMHSVMRKVNKPFMLVEYSHAMGNSSGGLKEYLEIFRSNPKSLGGFIWDWVDQGVLRWNSKEKLPYYAYGGDFGPSNIRSDGNFLLNGIIQPDRKPSPSIPEVARWYGMQVEQPYSEERPLSEFRVLGDTPFVLANQYELKWELSIDGFGPIVSGKKEFRFKDSADASSGHRFEKIIRIDELTPTGLEGKNKKTNS